jgi:hypothetical protein
MQIRWQLVMADQGDFTGAGLNRISSSELRMIRIENYILSKRPLDRIEYQIT